MRGFWIFENTALSISVGFKIPETKSVHHSVFVVQYDTMFISAILAFFTTRVEKKPCTLSSSWVGI